MAPVALLGVPLASRPLKHLTPVTLNDYRLITTSCQPPRLVSTLSGEVEGLDFPTRRRGARDQALGFEVGEAVAEVALSWWLALMVPRVRCSSAHSQARRRRCRRGRRSGAIGALTPHAPGGDAPQ